MAQLIQQRLEDGVDELQALISRGLLEEDEVREVIKRRRTYEFSCASSGGRVGTGTSVVGDSSPRDFLVYIQYEANLLSLLRHRCTSRLHATQQSLKSERRSYHDLCESEEKTTDHGGKRSSSAKKKKKRQKHHTSLLSSSSSSSSSDAKKNLLRRKIASKEKQLARLRDTLNSVRRTGIRRIYSLISRMLQKHSASLPLWYTSVDLLLQIGASRLLQRFLFQAVQRFPRCPSLWILSADRLLAQGEIHGARRLLLQSLRFCPKDVPLWVELLKLESMVLIKALQASAVQEQKARERKQLSSSSSSDADEEGKTTTERSDDVLQAPSRAANRLQERQVETEEDKNLKCQGKALAVVFKGAVSKLSEREKKIDGSFRRRSGSSERVEDTRENKKQTFGRRRRRQDDSEPESLTARRETDDVSTNANLHCFLYQSLMICLNLQASLSSQVSSSSSSLLLLSSTALSPFQNLLTSMLHQSTASQPLFKVYEWKVQLLQAGCSRPSPVGGSEDVEKRTNGEGQGGNGEESRRHLLHLAEVQKVLKSIFAECCVNSHLLLLFSLFLRSVYLSEAADSGDRRNSSGGDGVTCTYTPSSSHPDGENKSESMRTNGLRSSGDHSSEFDVVLDVEGEDLGEEEAEERMSGHSQRKDEEETEACDRGEVAEGKRQTDEEDGSSAEEEEAGEESVHSVGSLGKQMKEERARCFEDDDHFFSLRARDAKTWHDSDVDRALGILSGCLFPEISLLLQEQASIPSACLLRFASGKSHAEDEADDEEADEATKHEGEEIDGQCSSSRRKKGGSDFLVVADSHILEKQRLLLRALLFSPDLGDTGREAEGESVTHVLHQVEENRRHRLWLLRCMYTALVQLFLQNKKRAEREGRRRQEDTVVLQETIAVTASLMMLILVDSVSGTVASDEENEDTEKVFLSNLKQVSRDLRDLLHSAYDSYPCVRLFLLLHDDRYEVLKTICLLSAWGRDTAGADSKRKKKKKILLSQLMGREKADTESKEQEEQEEEVRVSLSRRIAEVFSFEEGKEEAGRGGDEEKEGDRKRVFPLSRGESLKARPAEERQKSTLFFGGGENSKMIDKARKFLQVWKKQEERRSDLYFPSAVKMTWNTLEDSKCLTRDDSSALLSALIRCWHLHTQDSQERRKRRFCPQERGLSESEEEEEEGEGGEVRAPSLAWFRDLLEVSQPQSSYRLTQLFLQGVLSSSLHPSDLSTHVLGQESAAFSNTRREKDAEEEDLFLSQTGTSSGVLEFLVSGVFQCYSVDTPRRLLSVLATCQFALERIWRRVRESLDLIKKEDTVRLSSSLRKRGLKNRRVSKPPASLDHQGRKRKRKEEKREKGDEEEEEAVGRGKVCETQKETCGREKTASMMHSKKEDVLRIRERKGKILMWLSHAQRYLEMAVDMFERCGVCTLPDQKAATNPFLRISSLPGERRGTKISKEKSPLIQKLLQVIPNLLSLHEYWWIEFWRFAQFCEVFRSQRAVGLDRVFPFPSPLTALDNHMTLTGVPRLGVPIKTKANWISIEEVERRASVALGGGAGELADFLGVVTAEDKCVKAVGGKSCQVCSPSRMWCLYTEV